MSGTLSAALKKPVTLDEQIESICAGTSYVQAASRIKIILKNEDGYATEQLREIFEAAKAREVRARPQRRAVIQSLRNALKKLPADAVPTPPSKLKRGKAREVSVEVVTNKEAVLTDASKALEKLRVVIVKHEETFAATTLGPRLQIGLQCLKAHHAFAIPADKNKRGGRPSKNPVTRDAVSPEGFEGWLVTEAQWLKKPTAYKYMTAVRGLGLDHDATEKQVAAALKLQLRKGPVTIKSLCDAALESIAPPAPEAPKIEQTDFEFLKQLCSGLREETDSLIANKDTLDAHPDFKRAALARLYSALHDLSGSHWKPSDEPDDLALVDPDAISL